MAAPQVVYADNKETVGVQRAAGADDVVPPADIVRRIGVVAGDVMMTGERVADEDGVRLGGIERTVGLVDQIVGRQNTAAAELQCVVEMSALRLHDADGLSWHAVPANKKPSWPLNSRANWGFPF